jgi:DNA-binding CsgD family transcriptional regulator
MTEAGVLVVHPEALVAQCIGAALSRHRGVGPVLVSSVAEEAEAVGIGARAAVVDDRLPGGNDLAARLHEKGVQVVLLASHGRAVPFTIVGRDRPVEELAAAVAARPVAEDRLDESLSRRQREILELTGQGLPAKQVARRLGISPKTVEMHKTRIYSKLGVPNQTAACLTLAREGGRMAS